MQAFLQGHGLWEHINNRYTKSDVITISSMIVAQRNKYDEGKKREGRAKVFILSELDYSMLPKVTTITNAKKYWDILKVAYQGNDLKSRR